MDCRHVNLPDAQGVESHDLRLTKTSLSPTSGTGAEASNLRSSKPPLPVTFHCFIVVIVDMKAKSGDFMNRFEKIYQTDRKINGQLNRRLIYVSSVIYFTLYSTYQLTNECYYQSSHHVLSD